jgi:hypothetical protein
MGVLACVAAALAHDAAPAIANEGCPNEQLRMESNADSASAAEGRRYSQLLPECRAYEMVSPPFKQSHDVGVKGGLFGGSSYNPAPIAVAPAGDAVRWVSQGDFGEPENYALDPTPEQPFVSRRHGEAGWSTSSAFAPQKLILEPEALGVFGDFSTDLTSHQLSCGWVNLAGNTHAEKYQGTACARREGEGEWERTPPYTPIVGALSAVDSSAYEGGSADLSRAFLQVEEPLVAEDYVPNARSATAYSTAAIYEVSPVGTSAQLRLVNVGHEGAEPSLLVRHAPSDGEQKLEPPLLGNGAAPTEYYHGSTYHAVSESGETVFFVATPEDSEKETGRTAAEGAATAVYARIPCSSEFPALPCETVQRGGQMVEGRQTVKVSDPNEAEGCAACATPTAVGSAATTKGAMEVKATGGFPGVEVGMAVSGEGIPSGTVVSAVSTDAITLSKAATKTTESGKAVTLTFSPVVANVTTTEKSATVSVSSGGFPGVKVGMAVSGSGIESGTTVSSYVAGEDSLTLSRAATAGGSVTLTFKTELKPVVFQGAAADGSKIFFTTEQRVLPPNGGSDSSTNLYEYDFNRKGNKVVDLSPDTSGSAQVLGVVRSSADGKHVYFIAKGKLTSERPVSGETEGEEAKEGAENLYGVDTETDEVKFIATVTGLSYLAGTQPTFAQTTPDGRDLVFDSTATLAGETNPEPVNYLIMSRKATASKTVSVTFSTTTSKTTIQNVTEVLNSNELSVPSGGFPGVTTGMAVSGEGIPPGATVLAPPGNPQAVYRYDFKTGELIWISQASPELKAERQERHETPNPDEGLNAFVAPVNVGRFGAWASIDDESRAISGEANGAHDAEDVIFTTAERLQRGDESAGEQAQLYLWRCAAPCPHPNREGVVRMISDGRDGVEPRQLPAGLQAGEQPTTAISASGSDIFFSTRTPLVGQDGDELIDYYDARIDGGYAAPAEGGCAGEGCPSALSASSLGSFGSTPSSVLGAGGNLTAPLGGALAFHTALPKSPTRAQKLAKALKACRKRHQRRRRVACERRARKRYGHRVKANRRNAHGKQKKHRRGSK